MEKNLVIVDLFGGERIISEFLGEDFIVRSYCDDASALKSKTNVDVYNNFESTYEIIPNNFSLEFTLKSKIVNERLVSILEMFAASCEKVYFAANFDCEGEAFSWHLKEALNIPDEKIARITFHEITREAIKRAVQNPRSLDMGLVNSYQARNILDRLVGYKL
jgi:DNA topoisomerase-1